MTDLPSDRRNIVVIGASAGGVEALRRLVARLPADLPAAVFVVIHVTPFARSTLPSILNRDGSLPAAHAADAEPIRAGRIYIAPPDRHLMLAADRIRVTRGPRENGHRPAVDPLFRTAAVHYGPRVVGVVLTGILDDGAAGLCAVKQAGGVAIVQADAAYPDMPRNAARATTVDHDVPLDQVADVIQEALATPPADVPVRALRIDPTWDAPFQASEIHGRAAEITCPACGGVLTEVGDHPLRYRCRVGHAYTGESLVAHQTDSVEAAMWAALRALEERATLLQRIADRFAKRGSARQAERYEEDVQLAQQRASIVRHALIDQEFIESEGPLPSSDEPNEDVDPEAEGEAASGR